MQFQSFQSPAIPASFCCFLLKEQTLDPTVYVCLFTEPDSTVDVEIMQESLLHLAITFELTRF